jgi:hypothetical protein
MAGTLNVTGFTQVNGNSGDVADFSGNVQSVGALYAFGNAVFNPTVLTAIAAQSIDLTGTLNGRYSFNVSGGFEQSSSGTLGIELGGPTAVSQYNQIQIAGTATLAGTLNVSLTNNFQPQDGSSFQIMTFGASSGNFSAINGLNLGNGQILSPVLSATSLTLVLPKASPTLLTTASFKAGSGNLVGVAIPEDSATLSGGNQETGPLTFTLYAPDNTVVDTQTITPNGDGTYATSNTNVATEAGTYTWKVAFAGDNYNNAAQDQGGAAEQVTTVKASPTLVTTASFKAGSGNVVGSSIPEDSATLSGGNQETGLLTFTLYAPDNTVADTQTITPSGNGTYVTSNTNVAEEVGTYTWKVAFAGDNYNNATQDQGGTAEQLTTVKTSPSLVSAASFKAGSGSGVGSAIPEDSAVLSGGYKESGPITFTLYAPDNSIVDTETVTPNGDGTYATSNTTVATQVGTYTWRVSYAGDSLNNGANDQGGASEQLVTYPTRPVQHGDFAGIGFWHNKNGQALINSLNGGPNSTALAQWLVANFPNLYGAAASPYSMTTGSGLFTNAQVAASYLANFFTTGTGAKTNAQILAAALAAYVTNPSLAGGNYVAKYGFNVFAGGSGNDFINVGSNGTAFGVPNNTTLTVFQMLKAVNAQAASGIIYAGNPQQASLANMANNVFDSQVNSAGGITLLTLSSAIQASQVSLGSAQQLNLGTLLVYVDNSDGEITPDEEARIEDAAASLTSTLGTLGIDLVVTTDSAAPATVTIQVADTTDIGGVPEGVLAVTEMGSDITVVNGWNWYSGADPGGVAVGQYDFESVVAHELGHGLGLGHSTDTNSVMYPYLGTGTARRSLTSNDLQVLESDGGVAPEPLRAAPAALQASRVVGSSILGSVNVLPAISFGASLPQAATTAESWAMPGTLLSAKGRSLEVDRLDRIFDEIAKDHFSSDRDSDVLAVGRTTQLDERSVETVLQQWGDRQIRGATAELQAVEAMPAHRQCSDLMSNGHSPQAMQTRDQHNDLDAELERQSSERLGRSDTLIMSSVASEKTSHHETASVLPGLLGVIAGSGLKVRTSDRRRVLPRHPIGRFSR